LIDTDFTLVFPRSRYFGFGYWIKELLDGFGHLDIGVSNLINQLSDTNIASPAIQKQSKTSPFFY